MAVSGAAHRLAYSGDLLFEASLVGNATCAGTGFPGVQYLGLLVCPTRNNMWWLMRVTCDSAISICVVGD